eukprot:TRINITY_DN2409_c0_g2_i1.p1 TRINITY_DN2409_c0_g2~~TRINITY_DN2409_c0_g2_i1.p1  ORF type:complete len:552 (-),score=158.07 TRINITY_DN2409_c0_g2_i1:358-2013(-)
MAELNGTEPVHAVGSADPSASRATAEQRGVEVALEAQKARRAEKEAAKAGNPSEDALPDEDEEKSCLTELYEFTEDPNSSTAAYVWSILILLLIVMGTVTMIVESLPSLRTDTAQRNLFIVESICVGFFTLELILRLVGWRFAFAYFKEPMNLIDLAAILPYYVDLALLLAAGDTPGNTETNSSDTDGTRVLRLFRLIRVFRVFKLSRHSSSMRLAVRAVVASGDTLWLMVFILGVMVITFGGLVYIFERGDWDSAAREYRRPGEDYASPYTSMPESMWWCLVTVMTVGYGDIVPTTDLGKLAASIAIICSVMVLALPISVIGLNFSILWSQERNQTEIKKNPELIDRTQSVLDQEMYWYNQDIQFTMSRLKQAAARLEKRIHQIKSGSGDDRIPREALEVMLKYEHLQVENLIEKCLRLVPISDTNAQDFSLTAYCMLILLSKRAEENFKWLRNTRAVVDHLEADMDAMAQVVAMDLDVAGEDVVEEGSITASGAKPNAPDDPSAKPGDPKRPIPDEFKLEPRTSTGKPEKANDKDCQQCENGVSTPVLP